MFGVHHPLENCLAHTMDVVETGFSPTEVNSEGDQGRVVDSVAEALSESHNIRRPYILGKSR